MVRFTRRTFIRRYLETPIEFRGHGLENSHSALMFNCCRGGMHFTSDCFIEPGSAIIVSPSEALAEYYHSHADRGLKAQVVWCRQCSDEIRQRFRYGVQFTPKDERGPLTDA
jgi:hypothetical protein